MPNKLIITPATGTAREITNQPAILAPINSAKNITTVLIFQAPCIIRGISKSSSAC
jgi:hypothetical protein